MNCWTILSSICNFIFVCGASLRFSTSWWTDCVIVWVIRVPKLINQSFHPWIFAIILYKEALCKYFVATPLPCPLQVGVSSVNEPFVWLASCSRHSFLIGCLTFSSLVEFAFLFCTFWNNHTSVLQWSLLSNVKQVFISMSHQFFLETMCSLMAT